eukprot:1159292-Pelagomonas_calceolata.AAC.5
MYNLDVCSVHQCGWGHDVAYGLQHGGHQVSELRGYMARQGLIGRTNSGAPTHGTGRQRKEGHAWAGKKLCGVALLMPVLPQGQQRSGCATKGQAEGMARTGGGTE